MIKLLYPDKCPSCDIILKNNEKTVGFCRQCSRHIRLAGGNVCMKCGKGISSESMEYCQDCIGRTHQFESHRGIYFYQGPMKDAMYKFKYANKRCFAKIFAKQAALSLEGWLKMNGPFDAVVPVPMYKGKKKKRGYNQAESFAKALGKRLTIPIDVKIVERYRDTAPMKTLNGVQRRKNIENAFKFSENNIKYKKVLLVDDIYTTGNTMDAVTMVLKEGGVNEVYCLSICVGESS